MMSGQLTGVVASKFHWDLFIEWLDSPEFVQENELADFAVDKELCVKTMAAIADWYFFSINDDIVGYSGIGRIGGSWQMPIYVRPEYRGSGYGRQMQESMIKRADADGRSPLTQRIRPDNAPMLSLSESTGFKRVRDSLDDMGYIELGR